MLTKSWRKVCKSVLLEDVSVVLLDELAPEAALSAATRLLKSDFNVLSALSVEEVEEVEEVEDVDELSPNCEINCCSSLLKVE